MKEYNSFWNKELEIKAKEINLTKIETRPSKNQAWAYVFFIDFEGHTEDTQVQGLFKRLDTCTAEIKILGSYPISQS